MSDMSREDAEQLIQDNVSEIQRLIESAVKTAKENGIYFEIDVPTSNFLSVLCNGDQMYTYDDAYDKGWISSNC